VNVPPIKSQGIKTAVISGGFQFATDLIKKKLGLDHSFGNVLEVKKGKLTGKVTSAIVNPQRKVELLKQIIDSRNIALEETLAIGDGANDIPMLKAAGIGIAFNGKPIAQEAADLVYSGSDMEILLPILLSVMFKSDPNASRKTSITDIIKNRKNNKKEKY